MTHEEKYGNGPLWLLFFASTHCLAMAVALFIVVFVS